MSVAVGLSHCQALQESPYALAKQKEGRKEGRKIYSSLAASKTEATLMLDRIGFSSSRSYFVRAGLGSPWFALRSRAYGTRQPEVGSRVPSEDVVTLICTEE